MSFRSAATTKNIRSTKTYLQDILESIDAIQDYLAGLNLNAYQSDRKTRRAVEREFQILTEAAYRLGDDAPRLCPSIDWPNVRGLGNFLRHEYDAVENEAIWQTIHTRLPPLRAAVLEALANLQPVQSDPA